MAKGHVDFKHVREHGDFETVATHYGLQLTGHGDQRSALCCFHQEKTGSLKIHLAKRLFHCFGCGAKGNILEFVTLKEGGNPEDKRDLRKGAFKLAEICGIEPDPRKVQARPAHKPDKEGEEVKPIAPEPKPSQPANTEERMVENVPLKFELKLDPNHPYLAERGLDGMAIQTWGLGYCSRGMMKGRIAIPIRNERGELIAYAGRWASKDIPDGTPKYLLPEGFAKQQVLFGLDKLANLTPLETVILVESYWSVIRLQAMGYPAVSPMGHSVSERQCERLKSFGVKSTLVLFDGDPAGAQGVAESAPILVRQFATFAPVVPTGFKPHKCDDAVLQLLLINRRLA